MEAYPSIRRLLTRGSKVQPVESREFPAVQAEHGFFLTICMARAMTDGTDGAPIRSSGIDRWKVSWGDELSRSNAQAP